MSVPLVVTIAGAEAEKFKERIRQEAFKLGMSVSEYVVMAVAEYIRSHRES